MNVLELLARDFGRYAEFTQLQLEEAMGESECRTVSELAALALAKKAAEGNMDAIKFLKELSRGAPEQEPERMQVELRIVDEKDDP